MTESRSNLQSYSVPGAHSGTYGQSILFLHNSLSIEFNSIVAARSDAPLCISSWEGQGYRKAHGKFLQAGAGSNIHNFHSYSSGENNHSTTLIT